MFPPYHYNVFRPRKRTGWGKKGQRGENIKKEKCTARGAVNSSRHSDHSGVLYSGFFDLHEGVFIDLLIGIKYFLILFSALAVLLDVKARVEQSNLLAFQVFSSGLSNPSKSYRNSYVCPIISLLSLAWVVLSGVCLLAEQVSELTPCRLKDC